MKTLKNLVLVLSVFLLLGVSAQAAEEIYALASEDRNGMAQENSADTKYIAPAFEFGPSTLYKIDPETGVPTEIGPTGFASCQGLDIHPTTEELYAVCNRLLLPDAIPGGVTNAEAEDIFGQILVKLNRMTGEGTEIGFLGDGIGNIIGRRGAIVTDISFHWDGRLFAYLVAENFSKAEGENTNSFSEGLLEGNSIGTIELATGKFDLIGPTGTEDGYGAIGFSARHDLFLCGSSDIFGPIFFQEILGFIVDIFDGEAFLLGTASLPEDFLDRFNIVTSKDVDTASNLFYGLLNSVDENFVKSAGAADAETNNIAANGSFLVRINIDNGVIDVLNQLSGLDEDFLAIAVKSKPRAVPTMSEYGFIATVVLLLGASVLYLRRRQANSQI